jgi:hypothetical protein
VCHFRPVLQQVAIALSLIAVGTLADDSLYRGEGDVLPYDGSSAWQVYNPCEGPPTRPWKAATSEKGVRMIIPRLCGLAACAKCDIQANDFTLTRFP